MIHVRLLRPRMQQKIGLFALTSIVIGSQVGSGVFMLPQLLAPFGAFAIAGWVLSGLGALCLAMVFVGLVKRYPKTGGPHAYVQQAFGDTAAFFTGWTYWVVSSLSSATVIAATITYLTPIIGIQSPITFVSYELFLLFMITCLNLRGVGSASFVEILLGAIKLITLFAIPVAGLMLFNVEHISIAPIMVDTPSWQLIGKASALTLWAFLGVEAATAPAGSVHNPTWTIPVAIIGGTGCVIILYLLNSISIMGLIDRVDLTNTQTPYVLATQVIFGGNWHLMIAGFAALVCLSNLNAWILTSGQVALGIADDNLMPPLFKKKNRHGAPYWGLIISSAIMVPFIILTIDDNISRQIFSIISMSVQASIMIYLACIASYIVLLRREHQVWYHFEYIVAVLALLFCLGMMASEEIKTLGYAALFVLSGLPVYYGWLHQRLKNRTRLDNEV